VNEKYTIQDDGCWQWLGPLSGGYGRVGRGSWGNTQTVGAHRAFYEDHVGPIPEKHEIHHTCGNRACVNPEHLRAVSRAEHCRLDRAHLTPDDVRAIRASNESHADLGRRYSVTWQHIQNIRKGTKWVGV
jgi:HNH endonuclease